MMRANFAGWCGLASLLALVAGMAACQSGGRSTPPLAKAVAPTTAAAAPTRPNLLERTADATVAALKTPVRWVTPEKKAKPVVEETGPGGPAEAIIVSRRPTTGPATNP